MDKSGLMEEILERLAMVDYMERGSYTVLSAISEGIDRYNVVNKNNDTEVLVETTELGRSSGTVIRYDGLLGDVVRRIHEARERQVKGLNTPGRDVKDWVVHLTGLLGRVSASAYSLTSLRGAMWMDPHIFVEAHKTRSKLCADDIVELGAAVMRMAEHVVDKSDIKF